MTEKECIFNSKLINIKISAEARKELDKLREEVGFSDGTIVRSGITLEQFEKIKKEQQSTLPELKIMVAHQIEWQIFHHSSERTREEQKRIEDIVYVTEDSVHAAMDAIKAKLNFMLDKRVMALIVRNDINNLIKEIEDKYSKVYK